MTDLGSQQLDFVWGQKAAAVALRAALGYEVTAEDVAVLAADHAVWVPDDAAAAFALLRFLDRLRGSTRAAGAGFVVFLGEWRGGLMAAEIAKVEENLRRHLVGREEFVEASS